MPVVQSSPTPRVFTTWSFLRLLGKADSCTLPVDQGVFNVIHPDKYPDKKPLHDGTEEIMSVLHLTCKSNMSPHESSMFVKVPSLRKEVTN